MSIVMHTKWILTTERQREREADQSLLKSNAVELPRVLWEHPHNLRLTLVTKSKERKEKEKNSAKLSRGKRQRASTTESVIYADKVAVPALFNIAVTAVVIIIIVIVGVSERRAEESIPTR